MSCDLIDDKYYLTFNFEQECWTGAHQVLSSVLTIPMLFFWMIIFPGIFLVYMYKRRERLKESFVFQITKFFQVGYKREFFFWEFLTMLRKFIIILLTTFLRNQNEVVIYILIPIMAGFFFLQNYLKPFEHERHNRLEMLSLNASFLTYYCAVFYLRDISEEGKLFFLLVIFICNLVYFIIWLKNYTAVIKKNLNSVVSTLKSKLTKRTSSSSIDSKYRTNNGDKQAKKNNLFRNQKSNPSKDLSVTQTIQITQLRD